MEGETLMPAASNIGSSWIPTPLQIGFLFAGLAEAQSVEWVKPSLATLPAARASAALAYDADTHSTVLFGGGSNGDKVIYGDTWLFTRTSGWLQLSPATSPSPRTGSSFAYDPTTKTAVLFGGTAGNLALLNDTWTWDGSTWTQQFPPVSPPPRTFNTEQMAFDAANGTVVLFGGYAADGGFWGDTWVWEGKAKTWTEKFPATSPSPRGTTLTYDSATKQVVVFGGEDGGASFLNDTWTWDGITWTQQFPASSPSVRTNLAMAYDANIGEVVLFGGYSAIGGEALNDTWTWNGTTWSRIQTSYTPAGRYGASMDYDPNFRGLVLFGGYFTGGPWTNQTWLFTSR
jgi:hypothetical protein